MSCLVANLGLLYKAQHIKLAKMLDQPSIRKAIDMNDTDGNPFTARLRFESKDAGMRAFKPAPGNNTVALNEIVIDDMAPVGKASIEGSQTVLPLGEADRWRATKLDSHICRDESFQISPIL
jgi:hypothetical protein